MSPLTRAHWVLVLGGLLGIDAMLVTLVASRRLGAYGAGGAVGMTDVVAALHVEPGLILPALASLAYVLLAWRVRRRSPTPRQAGQAVMLYGLPANTSVGSGART